MFPTRCSYLNAPTSPKPTWEAKGHQLFEGVEFALKGHLTPQKHTGKKDHEGEQIQNVKMKNMNTLMVIVAVLKIATFKGHPGFRLS